MSEVHEAVKRGDLPGLRSLAARGADLNEPEGGDGFAPLDLAMQANSNLEILDYLLGHGAKSAVYGGPIRIWALDQWTEERLAVFVAHIDLVSPGDDGMTALHSAVEMGDRRAVRLLLERGAVPSFLNGVGETAASMARRGGAWGCALELSSWARHTDAELTHQIRVAAKIDPNSRPILDATCLCCACNLDNNDLVAELIDLGADPNLLSWGWAPILFAAANGNLPMTRKLLEAGASTGFRSPLGDLSAYDFAVLRKEMELAAILKPHTPSA